MLAWSAAMAAEQASLSPNIWVVHAPLVEVAPRNSIRRGPSRLVLFLFHKFTSEELALNIYGKRCRIMVNFGGGVGLQFTRKKITSGIIAALVLVGASSVSYQAGIDAGHDAAYTEGYQSGEAAGRDSGYQEGLAVSYDTGYAEGKNAGYDEGMDTGHTAGYDEGLSAGKDAGYKSGYDAGVIDGKASVKSSTTSTASNTASTSKAAQTTEDTKTVTVYVTKTGEKYHRDGCQYLRKSQIAISLSSAKSQGYTPCSKCSPPR